MDAADVDGRIEAVVAAVRAARKYRSVMPELVRRIAAQELQKRARPREALKAVKNRLHQVAGAYLAAPPDYAAALEALRAAAAEGPQAFRAACLRVMQAHASTRERVPILEELYATALAGVAPVASVLDVACGLNPLAAPWMPLAPGARYVACDIYQDLMAFLQAALALAGVHGETFTCDLVAGPPPHEVELALVLKAVPCLEQVDRGVGARLLEGLRARHVLVSYPARSLGGRKKGMVENYDEAFQALVAGRPWTVQRFELATELAFLVTK